MTLGFSSHTMNKCFCHLLSAVGFFFTFLCYSAKELSSVSQVQEGCDVPYRENRFAT